jgi:Mrp family chromosome partitioning ATPase
MITTTSVRPDGSIDPRLVLLREPTSDRAAAFRLLCQRIATAGLPRILAVSSANRHDGKTTCAINLAIALVERLPTSVLLVDGNFFEPSLAQILAIDEHTPHLDFPSLGPFQIFELSPRLHVAAIVPSRGEPAAGFETLTGEAMVERLSQLPYDRLVIDAPALDGSPRVERLLAATDAVLFAVRSGHTSRKALRRAVEEIGPEKALGAALIDA